MALPKRKISKSRRNKRRTHQNLTAATVVKCSQCNEPRLPHRVCPSCGYYRGRPVLSAKEK